MSMISAQIDELRELAGDGSMEWVAGPIRASVLRDAADTIWQLRDDLQRANAKFNAENVKLRQELAIREASEQEKVIEYLRQENIDWEDNYRALAAENAKLREQGERLFDKTLELGTKNAELREELAKARDPQRIGGQADPSSFVYAIEQLREFRWQHATNDEDTIPYINNVAAAHERENAKLRRERDMYRDLVGMMDHPDLNAQLQADNAKLRELLQRLLTEYRYMRVRPRAVYLQHEERMRAIEEEMRELGIEVE